MPKRPNRLEFILKYWQAIVGMSALAIGGIVFLATLQPRVLAMEKRIEEHEKTMTALTIIQEQNQELMNRQQQLLEYFVQRPAPAVPVAAPRPARSSSPATLERTCFDERTWEPKACEE